MKIPTLIIAAILALATPSFPYAADKLDPTVIIGTADATVGLNGLVCDFCSLALNKTFKKNDAVAAAYVDLDAKELSIIFKEGQSLDDAAITKLVKKAGYSVTKITRKSAS